MSESCVGIAIIRKGEQRVAAFRRLVSNLQPERPSRPNWQSARPPVGRYNHQSYTPISNALMGGWFIRG
jgi:hypothetical protein